MQKLEQQKENVVVIGKEEQKIRTFQRRKLIAQNVVIKKLSTGLCKHEEQTNRLHNSSDAQAAALLGERILSTPLN